MEDLRLFVPTCPVCGAECGDSGAGFLHAVLCGDVNLDGIGENFGEEAYEN